MKYLRLFVVAITICFTSGCIHKNGSGVTPWERVATYNAVFAQSNDAIEQGTEAAAASGVLSVQQAYPVIAFTGQVALAHQQITAILAKGANVSASDFGTVDALLQTIAVSGQQLVASGAIGVKNPKTQQTIAQDVTALVSLAQTLLSTLQSLQQNPAPPVTPAPPVINTGSKP